MGLRATEQQLRDAMKSYLQPGESLQHVAYGITPPFILTAVIPILYALLTTHYVVGLTNRRLIVLKIATPLGFSFSVSVKQMFDIPLGKALGQVSSHSGPLFTYVTLAPAAGGTIKLKFHRMGLGQGNNREQAEAIGAGLQQFAKAA